MDALEYVMIRYYNSKLIDYHYYEALVYANADYYNNYNRQFITGECYH